MTGDRRARSGGDGGDADGDHGNGSDRGDESEDGTDRADRAFDHEVLDDRARGLYVEVTDGDRSGRFFYDDGEATPESRMVVGDHGQEWVDRAVGYLESPAVDPTPDDVDDPGGGPVRPAEVLDAVLGFGREDTKSLSEVESGDQIRRVVYAALASAGVAVVVLGAGLVAGELRLGVKGVLLQTGVTALAVAMALTSVIFIVWPHQWYAVVKPRHGPWSLRFDGVLILMISVLIAFMATVFSP